MLDFSSVSSTTIQISPYKPGACLTIALDDTELASADTHQYERFWRVWQFERANYAPQLKNLTIVLRMSGTPYKGFGMSGIEAFVRVFDAMRASEDAAKNHAQLAIYIDSQTEVSKHGIMYEVHTEPECIYTLGSSNESI